GIANPTTGWGIQGDTFETLEMLGRYGRDIWFRLGDRDFATHIMRTERLRAGATLSDVATEFSQALGIQAAILPMANESVASQVQTPDGPLDFQEYFVHRHQSDAVTGVIFRGIEQARVTSQAAAAFVAATAVVFCPSNPIVSIGPILAVPGLRERIARLSVPKVAVSPIVGGRALRGPADRMLETLGHEVSAVGVAKLYQDILTGMVIDEVDAHLAPRIEALGLRVLVAPTIMVEPEDRQMLAQRVLDFCGALSGRPTANRSE
ncbi:MAG: 2-phospho-L-lactate transferase CofD family protein, partial [Candidatus Limnocylindrales bacterium]